MIYLNMNRNLSVELRPNRFEDLIGMDYIVNPLLEGLKQGRVDSAYLFSGQPGSGKTTIARILASYVQEMKYTNQEYDIDEINTASCNTADDARLLIQKARYNPWTGQYKVIILDECQRLTPAAQQILLKDIEEPSPRLIWMPCSSQPGKIDSALKRRCVHYQIKGLTGEETAKLVTTCIEKLGVAISRQYLSKCSELSQALIDNQVTSSGFIVRAIEKYITGVPAQDAALVFDTASIDVLEVCRATAKGDWKTLKKLLQAANSDDGRVIRNSVTGYFRSMLYKADSSGPASMAANAIHELTDHSTFEEGLQLSATAASLYKICMIIKKD